MAEHVISVPIRQTSLMQQAPFEQHPLGGVGDTLLLLLLMLLLLLLLLTLVLLHGFGEQSVPLPLYVPLTPEQIVWVSIVQPPWVRQHAPDGVIRHGLGVQVVPWPW